MPFPDLQSFLAELEKRDQLRRVKVEVDPVLEVTEIADRMMKSPSPEGAVGTPKTDPVHGHQGGRGLLFDNVKGSSIPLAINIFGSYARVKLALGTDDFEELAARVQQLVKPEIPTTLLEKLKKIPELAKMAGYSPKIVKRGICQEVVHTDDADLFSLPIIQCWPHDGDLSSEPPHPVPEWWEGVRGQVSGVSDSTPQLSTQHSALSTPSAQRTGRYITLAGIHTKDPETGDRNIGMYRVQLFGPKLAAMHWHMHHDGARHFRKYAARNEPMPLAIALGGESVLPYAATCPLPPAVSELLFSGFLNGTGIDLVPCKTIPLEVPANSEIIIEGWVDPKEKFIEGPFGDHTGFYSLSGEYPVFRVTAITHRTNPVYPTTIVGRPPMEDYYLGKATERIFLPLLKMIVPDVVDYSLPQFGAFHNFVFVKIRKEYPYQARRVMHALWGAGQMSLSKFIIVVDQDVDVHDEQAVLFAVGAHVDPRRDIAIVDGPLDILDHAAPFEGAGSKMGIDATRKIQGEGTIRRWPMEMTMSPEIIEKVTRRWKEYGL
jgi:4-hydroxy-3-polyprenylbenzoate decarboxylase